MARVQTRAPADGEPPAALVRAQLARILSSEIFARSDRLSAFLTFIVEQTLNGQGDSLKEQVIATALYGKPADFSTADDPIVRVDARRLRDRLREYYASAPGDAVLISVPKGTYAPTFALAPQHEVPAIAASRPPMPRHRWRSASVLALACVVCGSAVWLALRARADPAVRLLTVTAYPGLEGGPPSICPDGNFILFAWTGPNFRALGDLYVKDVEGNALRRLTETPLANEVYRVWSPDGRQIAFARVDGEENRGIYVMSALGGADRKIVDWGWRAAWRPLTHARTWGCA
jgi:hypothetical protein